VDRALSEAGLGWDAWPQAATDATLDASVRLSALLLMLGLAAPRIEREGGYRELADPTVDAIDRLRRNKLPWDAATATTALRTVTALEDFDDRRVTVALRGAEQVCAAGLADAALLDALLELSEALDHLAEHVWRVPETQELARRVLVAASPPELLDLTLLREHGDGWGGPAREAARQAPSEAVAPLVRLLGELGPRKPSRTWLAAVSSALAAESAYDLLRRWLELAADADVSRRARTPRWHCRAGCCSAAATTTWCARRYWRAGCWTSPGCPACWGCWPCEALPPVAHRG
jgi:hypothetical protein